MQADKQAIAIENINTLKKFIKYPVQLFGVFIIIFGIIPFFIYFNVSRVSGGEENWPATEAEVIAAEVKTSVHTERYYAGEKGARQTNKTRNYDKKKAKYTTRTITSFSPEITYKFSIDGKEYTGRKFRTLGFSSQRESEIKELIARYPVGQRITVYYNPAKNDEAVIEKAPAPSKILLVFGGGVVLLGLLIVFVFSRIAGKLFDIITSPGSRVDIKLGN